MENKKLFQTTNQLLSVEHTKFYYTKIAKLFQSEQLGL